ncbi:MAG: hypothetical protein HY234_05880 [Acidobacteria bacterium]|nr:hypothetical protein [Acidobacteriota bacterium]MBI3662565.1 hypothetical protein [Acidobacteriota bacterium]
MNRIRLLVSGTLALFVFVLAPAGAQQPSQLSQAEKPKPAAKRVWSNDDLESVRKPWDEFADQKRAADEAARVAAQAPAKAAPAPVAESKTAGTDAFLPKTVDEAENRIAEKREEIQFQMESIDRTREEYSKASSDQSREALKKKLGSMTTDLDEAIAELKALDRRLHELKAKTREQPPQPPAPSSGS